jgi:zinc finger protein
VAISAGGVDFGKSIEEEGNTGGNEDFVSKFSVPCYCCEKDGLVQMCKSSIPFFKEIIIIAFVCDHCGYRNAEIKEGGGMSERAKKITIKVEKVEDLNRDVFKSNTCLLRFDELDFEL